MSEAKVIVYSREACSGCHAQKAFLKEQGVAIEERNIDQHHRYIHELQELGSSAVPTTVIGDRVIVGFNPAELRRLLDL